MQLYGPQRQFIPHHAIRTDKARICMIRTLIGVANLLNRVVAPDHYGYVVSFSHNEFYRRISHVKGIVAAEDIQPVCAVCQRIGFVRRTIV